MRVVVIAFCFFGLGALASTGGKQTQKSEELVYVLRISSELRGYVTAYQAVNGLIPLISVKMNWSDVEDPDADDGATGDQRYSCETKFTAILQNQTVLHAHSRFPLTCDHFAKSLPF